MKYKLTLIFCIACLISSAKIRYLHGTITFNNDSLATGLIRFQGDHKAVWFKKSEEERKTVYTSKSIKRVKFIRSSSEYVFKLKKNKIVPYLVKVVYEGRVNIYTTLTRGASTTQGNITYYGSGGTLYWVCKPEENKVIILAGPDSRILNFRKKAMLYFRDCPVVTDKVKNKSYHRKDRLGFQVFLTDIKNEYN